MADGQIPGKFICLRTQVFHTGKSHNDDLSDSHRHQQPLIDQANASSKLHKQHRKNHSQIKIEYTRIIRGLSRNTWPSHSPSRRSDHRSSELIFSIRHHLSPAPIVYGCLSKATGTLLYRDRTTDRSSQKM
jgi:hypothetical protein